MRTITNSEFTANPGLWLGMASRQDVRIRKGRDIYRLIHETPAETLDQTPLLEPDDDLRRAISAEEFRKGVLEIVDKVHRKFYGNERTVSPGNA
jgi:hypothetical protein